jgi:PAS domain-containing serine/threonine kinase
LTPVNEDQTTVEEINMSNSLTHIGTAAKCNTSSNNLIENGTPPNSKKNSLIVVEQQKTPSPSAIMTTSTPDIRKRASIGLSIDYAKSQQPQQFNYNYVDGKYKGEAVHSDGNIIDIVYTIYKHQLPPSNSTIYLVWISRDPHSERSVNADEEGDEEKQFNLTLTLNSLTSTIETSFGGQGGSALKNTTASSACLSNATSMMTSVATAGSNTLANITSQASRPNSLSIISQEEEQISGEYCKNYTTLKQIGKGAYGYELSPFKKFKKIIFGILIGT